MSDDLEAARRSAAERRVREKQARQMAALLEGQEEQRRRDLRDQKQALAGTDQREAALIEAHRIAIERVERDWQQRRDRLGATPSPAPAFGLLPLQRDLRSEYDRAHEQYLRTLHALERQREAGRAAYQRDRADKLEAFGEANRERERGFEEDGARKQEDQRLGFEILVHRQMQRGPEPVREEFARSARPPERNL